MDEPSSAMRERAFLLTPPPRHLLPTFAAAASRVVLDCGWSAAGRVPSSGGDPRRSQPTGLGAGPLQAVNCTPPGATWCVLSPSPNHHQFTSWAGSPGHGAWPSLVTASSKMREER
jgi:hypothetical protein